MMVQIKYIVQVALVLLLSLGISSQAIAKGQPLDRIITVINDTVITQSELDEAINLTKKQLKSGNMPVPTYAILQKQVLDQLINKKLQMLFAEQIGIKITDTDVDKAIHTIAQNNKINVKELHQKIIEQGMSIKEFHKEIHDQILLQQAQQQAVGAKITISPQEVEDFMRSKTWQAFNTKEYHLEDILITLPENPSPQDVAAARNHAEHVLANIHRGTPFSEVAAAESNEKNALQGGDLGWRKLPEIPALFSNEIIHMKANDLAGPIQTPNGFHIVRLVGSRTIAAKGSAAQQRSQVEQLIFQRKLEENTQSWVTKLRSEAFISTPKA